MSFAHAAGGGPTETEVRAHESAHRGRSPQGVGRRRRGRRGRGRARRACVLPAEPRRLESPRALGETVPRASLGGRECRRARPAPGGEVGGGRRVAVVDVPPKLSARVRVLSTGNARKNDGLDALATALAASRKGRLAQVDPEAASETLRLLSERRLLTWWPSVRERSRQPPRAPAGPPPRRGGSDALGRQSSAHPAQHTALWRRLCPPP
jgi:hypothetical protein